MAKYIYQDNDLRCKVSYNKSMNCIRLQLEKRWFWCLWVDVGGFVDIEVGIKEVETKRPLPNPITMDYKYAGCRELWDKGTFYLPQRVDKMFSEYIGKINRHKAIKDSIEKMINH